MPAVLRPNHEFEQRKLTKSATFGVDEDFSDPRRPRSGSGFANLHGLAVLGGAVKTAKQGWPGAVHRLGS